ncbi:hypothetical protein KFL_010380030 [Klebsormidium nitens]|uniref:Uncharacterized protein n=1 Tax=Klebsormidium nitens TaxID=105231 RepID=A0A1Y1ISL7_KLENI|nr:hypothetical protein KFL_010380030 [Klebsormidium nitens]|eukprot:GAQ92519.1 hypothetical protein KFL_010380030 [Klebsormidium nitens]
MEDLVQEPAGIEVAGAPSMPVDAEIAEAGDIDIMETTSWQWPTLDYGESPERVLIIRKQFQDAQRKSGAADKYPFGNFLKGVKWSPDGTSFLTNSEDAKLRVFDLPADTLQRPALDSEVEDDSVAAALTIWEGEIVYDFAWFPNMHASDPATCCFVATSRDKPVHLWDAYTGQLRGTYRGYNDKDEVTAAFSVAFSTGGDRLWCGYEQCIRVFDVARPGREYTEHMTVNGVTKEGQAGIISCLSASPDHGGLVAAGSYDRTVGIYSEAMAEQLFVLSGHTGGITQVQFSRDGTYLYSGARKDGSILCWDVRYTVGEVYRLSRESSNTNQRIAFDIEPGGRHLATGGEDGCVRVFDLTTGELKATHRAAPDTVNGFGFHPMLPLVATASGERRFRVWDEDDEEDEREAEDEGMRNSVSIWRFACSWPEGPVSSADGDAPRETDADSIITLDNGAPDKFCVDGNGEADPRDTIHGGLGKPSRGECEVAGTNGAWSASSLQCKCANSCFLRIHV